MWALETHWAITSSNWPRFSACYLNIKSDWEFALIRLIYGEPVMISPMQSRPYRFWIISTRQSGLPASKLFISTTQRWLWAVTGTYTHAWARALLAKRDYAPCCMIHASIMSQYSWRHLSKPMITTKRIGYTTQARLQRQRSCSRYHLRISDLLLLPDKNEPSAEYFYLDGDFNDIYNECAYLLI